MIMLRTWILSSLERVFPATQPGRSAKSVADVARNERFSFQVALRGDGDEPLPVSIEVTGPVGWRTRIRRVGYVPVRHLNTDTPGSETEGGEFLPGYAPDPLFNEEEILLPSGETHAFWISVVPQARAQPGDHEIGIRVVPAKGRGRTHRVSFKAYPVRLKPRRNFSVTHWFYVDALFDWYRTEGFDQRFWEVLPAYLRNLVDHGQDTLYVPVFTPPLDGVKRPSQLLKVSRKSGGGYRFDWTDVRRFIRTARTCGLTTFEWCHLFTQWGAKEAIRVYEGQGGDERLLWPVGTRATSETYREFLGAYLPALRRFLDREGLIDHSIFHVSDEPHGEQIAAYRKARKVLTELAPWMPVMDALSEIEYGRSGLTDTPVPSIQTALDFNREGIPSWCYYCCGPRGSYLNRLMDTPLSKIAMHGVLFYRWSFGGFLHWGANYWYRRGSRELVDPFEIQDAGAWPDWAYGDPFVIYPGKDGPIDSTRWEVFGESLQTYALLQTLGVKRNDPLLRPIRSFEDFPKSAAWLRKVKRKFLERAESG